MILLVTFQTTLAQPELRSWNQISMLKSGWESNLVGKSNVPFQEQPPLKFMAAIDQGITIVFGFHFAGRGGPNHSFGVAQSNS
jgi:hypothetical protein